MVLYSIGDAVRKTDAIESTIRYWVKVGKIQTIRTVGGQLLFDQIAVERISELSRSTPRARAHKVRESVTQN